MEGWEIIQKCELAPLSGLYGQRRFITLISQLSSSEFDRFCRSYLHLWEFYDSHKQFYLVEDTDFISQHPNYVKAIDPIDFDEPITFIKRG